MKNNLLPLAKEGISYFLISLSSLIIFLIFDFDFLAFVSFFITLFIAYSFRNPEREICLLGEMSFLSPVDGIVKSIEELHNSDYAYKIDIQSSYTDVAILRIPTNSTVDKVIRKNGTRVSEDSKLFRTLNENSEIYFTTTQKNRYKISHRLRRSVTPLFIELDDTQKLLQTSRYGLMLNGNTSIYLGHNFRMNISIGSELKAAESLMGYFS